MIEVRALARRYGAVHAARAVELDAPDGCITTLLGGNGSGKTTTLRAIAGLLRPDAGCVAIDGIEVGRDPRAARRRLGVFPNHFGLLPRLTVREHLEIGAALHGLAGATRRRAVDETLARLGLEALAARRTAGFSLGEQVKVALGRALVHGPANLVLDEPTRGLDVFSLRLLRELLARLRAEGICILLSSHDLLEVASLSDRIVVLAAGRTVASGAPAELLGRARVATLEEAFVTLATGSQERAA